MGDGDPPLYFDHRVHWMLGAPRIVAAPDPGTLPAPGGGGWSRVSLDPKLKADTLVRGFDFKTDDAMLRAAFFTVAATGQFLGGWTPWSTSVQLPDGYRVEVPVGSRIAVDLLHGPATPRPQARG